MQERRGSEAGRWQGSGGKGAPELLWAGDIQVLRKEEGCCPRTGERMSGSVWLCPLSGPMGDKERERVGWDYAEPRERDVRH